MQELADMSVQVELVRNNSRYPDILWEAFQDERRRQGINDGIEKHMANVVAAYRRLAQISEDAAKNMEQGNPPWSIQFRKVAKAFWLTNVSWERAFFGDVLTWADHHLPTGTPWNELFNTGGFHNFDSAHYAISKYLNGGRDIEVPQQDPSTQHAGPFISPVEMDLIDDLNWSELLLHKIIDFAPLAVLQSEFRTGVISYGLQVKPHMKKFINGERKPVTQLVALSFAKADLPFFQGLFDIFISRKLFSEEISNLIGSFLRDYEDQLKKFLN